MRVLVYSEEMYMTLWGDGSISLFHIESGKAKYLYDSELNDVP